MWKRRYYPLWVPIRTDSSFRGARKYERAAGEYVWSDSSIVFAAYRLGGTDFWRRMNTEFWDYTCVSVNIVFKSSKSYVDSYLV